MLTKKELDYVTLSQTPYPGDLYSQLALYTLKEALELFKEDYENKKYEMYFSDGSDVSFGITCQNIPHMLGLAYSTLKKLPEFKNQDKTSFAAFKILETIADNVDDMLKLNERERYNLFNFYRIYVRSMVFLKFSNFRNFNFSCINYKVPEDGSVTTTMKSDRFLFTQSGEMYAPYFMMGLAKDDKNRVYVETLFADKYPEKMFTNQRITIPTLVIVSSPPNYFPFDASPKEKLEQMNHIASNLYKYGCRADVASDYMYELNCTVQNPPGICRGHQYCKLSNIDKI